jgi:epoxyqueuosine reductase
MKMLDLSNQIKQWGIELGFQQVGITDTQLDIAEKRLEYWLAKGFHADMDYMHKHGLKRSRPALLHPETISIISVRMNYLSEAQEQSETNLNNPVSAFISRYALGRDYHKILRKRLQKLAEKIEQKIGAFGYRAFVDSAPVLEKAIAEKAGLGWIGKHSNLINKKAGSWFFLGEIYTSLPLQIDIQSHNHCGQCSACIDICPTKAIVAPYQLDAKRCISYLTIEHKGVIPIEFRPLMGNRIYGCDDCQLICPWNKFAKLSNEADFNPRHNLNSQHLLNLFAWTEPEFLHKTEGSAIRRIGYLQWQRNIAIALGNAPNSKNIFQNLEEKKGISTALVAEHIIWAMEHHKEKV